LNVFKVPYSETMVLFERSLGAVNLAPELIAGAFDFSVDSGWDELDDFTIIVLNIQAADVAFFRHKGDPANISLVCPLNDMTVTELQKRLDSLRRKLSFEFNVFEEPW